MRESLIKICVDTDCDMSLIDRKYLLKTRFEINIQKIKKLIRIRNIDDKLHDNSEYVILDFYISEKLKDKSSTVIHFCREVHIVDDFRVNVLLKFDILVSKKSVIDYQRKVIRFSCCKDLKIIIDIVFKEQRITRSIRATVMIVVSSHAFMIMSVRIRNDRLSKNRDYSFESKNDFQQLKLEENFFNHVVDVNVTTIQIFSKISK